MGKRWRLVLAGLGLVAVTATAVLAGATAWTLRPERLKARLAATLSARFNADVTIDRLDVGLMPMRVTGGGLTLRVRNRTDLPPFIAIDRFQIDLQPMSIVKHHVNIVHLDGLKIQVPPDEARKTMAAGSTGMGSLNPSDILIERLITHDAELQFVPDKRGHRPHVFQIHSLQLDRLAFDREIPFRAELVNPVPEGLIETSGVFGPWSKDDPGETPLRGRYVFSDAKLSTIDGLEGTLSSIGTFDGILTAVNVAGTTKTPDFNLQLGGTPLPLETKFAATVNGTDGTTILHDIDAMMSRTAIKARGAVVNLPGPGRHAVDLDVHVPRGRLEDLLSFITGSAKPVASGDAALRAQVHLPPGHVPVIHRLAVKGRFALSRTTFTGTAQQRIGELSRRSQGKPNEATDDPVASNVGGEFDLSQGVLEMRRLAFEVPGATVKLDGSGDLRTRALDLQGTLTMQTSVSKAVGGFKSIFLRVVDPFFRRPEGTVLPIKIQGTVDEPKASLRLRGR